MNTPPLEDVYEALARAIDAVGAPRAEVYLAKVCLSLASALDDPEQARRIVTECTRDLLTASDAV